MKLFLERFVHESSSKGLRSLLFDDKDTLLQVGLDRPLTPYSLDSIFMAVVAEETATGIFLSPNFFLPNKMKKSPSLGTRLLVQIAREPLPDLAEGRLKNFSKRPRVTQNIYLVGRDWRFQASKQEFTARSKVTQPDPSEKEKLLALYADIQERAQHAKAGDCLYKAPLQWERLIRDYQPRDIYVGDHDLFVSVQKSLMMHGLTAVVKHGLPPLPDAHESIWDDLKQPIISFSDGYTVSFEETSCVTAIDMNLTKNINRFSENDFISFFKEQALHLLRQIRWRQLGGNLIIDWPLPNAMIGLRRVLLSIFNELLKQEGMSFSFLDWSKMGWIELRIPHLRPSLLYL